MLNKWRWVTAGTAAAGLMAGLFALRAQDTQPTEPSVADPNCVFFGPNHDKLAGVTTPTAGALTAQVAPFLPAAAAAPASMPTAPGGSRTDNDQHPAGTIDKYIFQALSAAGVAPAPATTDYEFVRRIYLDLTGRIPTPAQTLQFVNDTTTDKRAKLVDSLIGSPSWLDKWTMWFGDLYQNNSSNTQINRYLPGVIAFNSYVRTSLTANKPYNQMASEIISAAGPNSYDQGTLNFEVGSFVSSGPIQDTFDQQATDTFQAFLGISHLNCLLCHNGKGHLDALSLWGYYTTRQQAWGVASVSYSAPNSARIAVAGATGGNPYYWSLTDNVPQAGQKTVTNYQLNTTTGNRPPRQPIGTTTTIAPSYIFGGVGPSGGENYRAALARMITSDFQFARAAVNYQWEYFFSIGLVSPSNQFDPLRQDPSNPPSNCPPNVPCTLQASNPQLLNALAEDFIQSGYDLAGPAKRRSSIPTPISSPPATTEHGMSANQTLFGRRLVRRLWSEEVHDAIAQSSGILPTLMRAISPSGPTAMSWGPVSFAMQFPSLCVHPTAPAWCRNSLTRSCAAIVTIKSAVAMDRFRRRWT